MAIDKRTLEFGKGHFLNDLKDHFESFEQLSPRDTARVLGWVAGCPVVERLTDPGSPDSRGAGPMVERYGEVSFWFTQIEKTVGEINPDLAALLTTRVARREEDEPLACDEESIPGDHFDHMAPIGTLSGYALPRVLIESIRGEDASDHTKKGVQDRLTDALDSLQDAAAQADTPAELTAILSEYLVEHHDVDPVNVLMHVLPRGWLDEHGADWMVTDMKSAIERTAPKLWDHYTRLGDPDIKKLHLL